MIPPSFCVADEQVKEEHDPMALLHQRMDKLERELREIRALVSEILERLPPKP